MPRENSPDALLLLDIQTSIHPRVSRHDVEHTSGFGLGHSSPTPTPTCHVPTHHRAQHRLYGLPNPSNPAFAVTLQEPRSTVDDLRDGSALSTLKRLF